MKRFCALLIAVLLLAGIPLVACAETVEEPAVILLDEPQETEDEAEIVAGEDTAPARKTDNNYNHKVLLSDDFCTVSVADASEATHIFCFRYYRSGLPAYRGLRF